MQKVQHRLLLLFFDITGVYNEGCAAFAKVSPNVVADESVMKTDEGMTMEQRYTVVQLTCRVKEIFIVFSLSSLFPCLNVFLIVILPLISGTWWICWSSVRSSLSAPSDMK